MISTIDQALTWIHSKRANGRRPSQMRMLWLLEQVSNPHLNFSAIHIVGTNGKGSTLAFLRSIFKESGYKVGSFSSPYITRYNERIAINAQDIPDKDLIHLCHLAFPIIESQEFKRRFVAITEFELVTFLMFLYFGQVNPVDIAIIEAGVGGEKDATAVLNQIALILTSVGLDHQDVLGKRLEDIAKTKLRAAHRSVPIYLNLEESSLINLATAIAQKGDNPLINLCDQAIIEGNVTDFSIQYSNQHWKNLKITLLGKHQLNNAALATCTALDLRKSFSNVTVESIQIGLANASWPGRTEWLRDNLLIDGAHNRDGLRALADLLKKEFPNKEIEILFAGLTTKSLRILEELSDFKLVVTSFPFPQARKLEDYNSSYRTIPNFEDWFNHHYSNDPSRLFVITGSLYFISYVRKQIKSLG